MSRQPRDRRNDPSQSLTRLLVGEGHEGIERVTRNAALGLVAVLRRRLRHRRRGRCRQGEGFAGEGLVQDAGKFGKVDLVAPQCRDHG